MDLLPHIGVLLRAAVMGGVFAGVYTLVTGGPFVVPAAAATAVLFVATEAVFAYAARQNQVLLGTAEAIQDEIDGE